MWNHVRGMSMSRQNRVRDELLLLLLLQLSFQSVPVALILVQTKHISINIHKQNNKKHSTNNTKHSKYKTPITKTPTLLPEHQHIHSPTHYKTSGIV